MSKNTTDSIAEERENVEDSTSLSSDGGDTLQEVTTLHAESLGTNEMSLPSNTPVIKFIILDINQSNILFSAFWSEMF